HYASEGVESWRDFHARGESARSGVDRYGPGENVAVFTSATPAAIWCARALGVDDRHLFRIAGVLYNSSFSTIRIRPEDLTLFTLNNTPHLVDAELRTFR
ncbi:MAG: histidine phosphatase family protein, partial [Bryobacteraceae bacterium]